MSDQRYLTVTDISRRLDVSERTARSLVNGMSHFRIGRKLLVLESEFAAWMETRRVEIQHNETAIAVLRELLGAA